MEGKRVDIRRVRIIVEGNDRIRERHYIRAGQMANTAISIGLGFLGGFAVGIRIPGVIVRMMTEMRESLALLVLAIRRRHRPGKLERQHGQQEDQEKTSHGRHFNTPAAAQFCCGRGRLIIVYCGLNNQPAE